MIRRVLVLDGEPARRVALRQFLAARGCSTEDAGLAAGVEEAVLSHAPDVVILSWGSSDELAAARLRELVSLDPDLSVIALLEPGFRDGAALALQEGADHCVPRGAELEELPLLIHRCMESRRAGRRVALGSREPRLDPFIGESAALRRLEQEARAAIESAAPILIEGEAGVGKSVLATWCHDHGGRGHEAFVRVSCRAGAPDVAAELLGQAPSPSAASAGARGAMDLADHGTLFLHEIGELDMTLQGMVLEAIEAGQCLRPDRRGARRIDVRVLATTRHDLLRLTREGRFREDLYYRLAAKILHVPSLRERPPDVPLLAARILDRLATDLGRPALTLTSRAREALDGHVWPGNVRELRNALERAAIRTRDARIEPALLGLDAARPEGLHDPEDLTLATVQRLHIERVLAASGGHVGRAAGRLGVPRSSLYQKVKQLGLR